MLLAGLSLVANVVAATPIASTPWFTFDDYPMKAFEKHWEGVTGIELLVSPDGSVASCTVTQPSGHAVLDEETCKLARIRGRFQPARGPNGEAVYGVYKSHVTWAMPGHSLNAASAADLEVSLNRLPAGTTQPAAVAVAYALDAQGHASGCAAMPDSPKQPDILVQLGCKQLIAKDAGAPVTGPSGAPVPAVKTGAVEFTSGR